MAHHAYATLSEATQCLIDGTAIALGGWDEIVAKKAALGEHEHAVQGFIHSVVLGTSDGPFTSMNADDENEFADKLQEFATAFQAARPNEIPMSAVEEAAGGNLAAGERKVDLRKWYALFVKYILPILITL